MASRSYRVGISGSYGGLNLGDEAILQGILAELRAAVPVEVTVFSRVADDTRVRHRVERVIPVRQLTRGEVKPEVQRLDLLILGGGGLLFDAEVRTFLREVIVAHECGVPVMAYAIGVGPLADAQHHSLVREALEAAAVVTVRDRQSKHLLEEMRLRREVVVTADPALVLMPEPLPPQAIERDGLDSGGKRIAISVREAGAAAPGLDEEIYHRLLADAADYMIDRYDADVFFVPMERQVLDLQQSHAVLARMLRVQRAHVLRGEYSAGQLLGLMKRFSFAVGMRLHFLIFAALCHVPFVALPYAPKVEGFLDDLGLVSPPMRLVNAGRLIAHIDRNWDSRYELQAHIEERLPALKERARQTSRLAVQLLTGETDHTRDAIA